MLKKLFIIIKNLFIRPTPKVVTNINKPNPKKETIAFVIGHNVDAQGAEFKHGNYTYSEYEFYKRFLNRYLLPLLDFKAHIIERPTGSYSHQCNSVAKKCFDLGVTKSFNFHFNSANHRANGFEALVLEKTTSEMLQVVQELSSEFKSFGLNVRHDNGINRIDSNHNGYGMLSALSSSYVDAIILEPFFGSNQNDIDLVLSNMSGFAQCFANVFNNHFAEKNDG
ncbi:MAG: N-acetylmuramoyl-L-alanine amidase [Candidatus Peregrinibacteria bacterium]|nr:N-acetylmuramoyl-L-alanine amidase [Candidatus Peregrinibacteria bacterium]